MRFIPVIICLFILQLTCCAKQKSAITPVIEYLSRAAKVGFEFIPIVGPYAEAVVNLGELISCIAENCLIPDTSAEEERKAIFKEIGILNENMDRMGQKIDDNYNSLKAFAVEHDFYTKLIIPSEAQFDFMRAAIKYRTQEAVDLFKKHYEAHHPIFGVVEISKRLRHHNVTNPILSAMHADPLRTKHTFEKWTACIHNLYTTMHISYLFNEGLNGRNATGSEQVDDTMNKAREILNNFIANYNNDYWPHAVERVMREAADDNEDMNNLVKAHIIKHTLQQIHTNDSFLILVYDYADGFEEHSFVASNKTSMVLQFRRTGCCMVVYRSQSARNMTNSDREDMYWDANWIVNERCERHNGKFTESVDSLFHGIPHAGFVGLINRSKGAQVQEVGDKNRRWYSSNICRRHNLLHSEDVDVFVAPH